MILPRWISSRHHPLKVYAVLELGIGACGVLALVAVPMVGDLYTSLPAQAAVRKAARSPAGRSSAA